MSPAAPDDPGTAALEAALGHVFVDRALLRRCLTHSSIARTPLESNERLEFLGDAILGAAVCERLFAARPDLSEGELTKLKSGLVSRRNCALLADRLELEPLIRTGKGLAGAVRATGRPGRVPRSVLSNAFEAVIAGVYLDGSWEAARACVNRLLDEAELDPTPVPSPASPPVGEHGPSPLGGARLPDGVNYKSRLQHRTQLAGHGPPSYELLEATGPDHARTFTVRAVIAGERYPPGAGATKKAAEQAAAAAALAALEGGG
ncbi:ribonuclease III family protein [Alienimonas californiensis]|uniref:Ribonuclease 3 n=1 Tax=Alienimonas californiensis TaxID=2527989 RepID=A0A517P5M2_9PLAN|nr:ribonuclease III [Alienimonas californiensis]QDT14674.1 Ribonuclease 3 [Alienimonas californiensis]